jgi:hypothetical protein
MLETSDVLVLARLQFAFTISAHIIFPAISIGLANYCAVLEGLWLRTGNAVYRELFFFWSKIFAVGFGMGVVSGVVMAYEFGANWAGFSRVAGSVNGPLLTRSSARCSRASRSSTADLPATHSTASQMNGSVPARARNAPPADTLRIPNRCVSAPIHG